MNTLTDHERDETDARDRAWVHHSMAQRMRWGCESEHEAGMRAMYVMNFFRANCCKPPLPPLEMPP